MADFFVSRRILFWLLFTPMVVGCGDNADAPVEIVINGNGPTESAVHGKILPPPDITPPKKCEDLECCEELLAYEDSPCQKLLLEKGKCRIETVDDGTVCGAATEGCGAVPGMCDNGECQQGTPGEDCGKLDVTNCEKATCSEETGKCVVESKPDGDDCTDGDPCNGNETCELGQCIKGPPLDCNDNNPCTSDSCGDSGCEYKANVDKPCDDENLCSMGDTCDAAGKCIGGTNICNCESDADCADKGNACTGTYKCVGTSCQPSNNGKDCDDGNPCTDDSCDPVTGNCDFSGNSGECNDGDNCTDNDSCSNGTCSGSAKNCDDGDECTVGDTCDKDTGECTYPKNLCQCEDASDCPSGNLCEGEYGCVDNTCVIKSGSVVDCSQSPTGPCETSICNPETGTCENQQKTDGETCDDGNQCTTGDKCVSGKCQPSGTLECKDNKICTKDDCDPGTGCQFNPLAGQPCSDNNKCTLGDVCLDGDCKGATPANCDDENSCTMDSCDPAIGCSNKPLSGTPCDDGDKCTAGDLCAEGTCLPGKNNCGCTSDDQCENDDNPCNGTVICENLKCIIKPGTVVICAPAGDQQDCLTPVCNPKSGKCELTNMSDGTVCDDDSKCTTGDVCIKGKCTGAPTDCDDGSPCTKEECQPSQGCVSKHVEGDCSDGDECTNDDFCNEGKCQSGPPVDCDDDNMCTSDFCLPKSGCKHGKSSGLCNDGDNCTINDLCLNGKCTSTAKTCNAPDKCHTASCDAVTGDCVETAVECTDNNSCTTDNCTDDTGCSYEFKDCDDGLACTDDSCDESTAEGCVNVAAGCSDEDPCTDDSCDADSGECVFTLKACDDDNECTVDACVKGQCKSKPVICDDKNPCTKDVCTNGKGEFVAKACDDGVDCTDDGCLEGECSHIADDQNCKDGNGCTSSTCDTDQGGCVYTELPEKNGGPCDDGNDDTTGDFCLTGHCAGMKITDVNVQGVSKSTALDHVTWSNGTFYIAGVEHVGGKDDSFLAVVTGTTASAIKKSIIEEEEYVAVHDRIALTEDADVLFNDNGTWDWNSKLDNSLGKTKVSNATAGWGFVSQNSGTFFFAGRSSQFKGGAWTVRCLGKNFTCAKVPVDMEQYSFAKSEHPRAIGGWHDGNKYGPILLADGKTSSGKNYNDAFTINAGAKSWATNYLDNSSSSSESTDVAGIDGSNLWWVGTNGLIRTGLTSGSPAWNSVNALSKQSELSFYGVAVDEHIVIMAGIRKSGNKVHLVLVTHNTLAGLSSEDAWYEYTLDSYEGSINDFVPTMRLTDIAMYKGNLVATGFRMEGIINSFQSLLVTRSAPYKK